MKLVERYVLLLTFAFYVGHAQNDGQRIDFLLDKLSSSSDFKVRIAAAQELGKVADGTVADWMLSSFKKEKNDAVRLAILNSVAQIPDERILAPLVHLTTQTPLQENEMLMIERTLWTFRKAIDTASWQKKLTNSSSSHEKGLAAWILGLTQQESNMILLHQASKDKEPSVRVQVYRAIGMTGSPLGKELCEKSSQQEKQTSARQSALNCIALIDAITKNRMPENKTFSIVVNRHLEDLRPASFKADTYKQYILSKQPRQTQKTNELLAAADNLKGNSAQQREERSIPVMESQEVLPTLRMSAEASSDFDFYAQDIAVLKATMKSKAKNIDDCYLSLLGKKIKAEGDLRIAVTITGSGKVNQVNYLKGSMDQQELRNCVSQVIKRTMFPNTGFKQVTVNYQFTFIAPKDTQLSF